MGFRFFTGKIFKYARHIMGGSSFIDILLERSLELSGNISLYYIFLSARKDTYSWEFILFSTK